MLQPFPFAVTAVHHHLAQSFAHRQQPLWQRATPRPIEGTGHGTVERGGRQLRQPRRLTDMASEGGRFVAKFLSLMRSVFQLGRDSVEPVADEEFTVVVFKGFNLRRCEVEVFKPHVFYRVRAGGEDEVVVRERVAEPLHASEQVLMVELLHLVDAVDQDEGLPLFEQPLNPLLRRVADFPHDLGGEVFGFGQVAVCRTVAEREHEGHPPPPVCGEFILFAFV